MSMWNLPNILTMARVGALPVILFLLWPGVENRETCFWAGILYGIAGALDMVDGAIARRLNLVTNFGKFLDPLADKVFYLVALVALLQLPGPRVPAWVVMLVLVRELAITGLRGIAVSDGIVIAAGKGGKVKTTFATLGIFCLIIHYPYPINFGFAEAIFDFHRLGLWVTYLSVAFSVSSGTGYIRGFAKAVRQRQKASHRDQSPSSP